MSYGTFAHSPPLDAPAPIPRAAHWALLLLLEIAASAFSAFLILVALLPLLGPKVAPSSVLTVSCGFTCLVFFIFESATALWLWWWCRRAPDLESEVVDDPRRLKDAEAFSAGLSGVNEPWAQEKIAYAPA
ncbi:hypothetical protein FB451DRAFT_1378622 [Mycena latifolia]|nr:hypothetical protein FB451DRAFT_1378622 [Mycena latifolia]